MSRMLPLDSPRWAELECVDGTAGDLPGYLAALPAGGWLEIHRRLGEGRYLCSATFAAVPYLAENFKNRMEEGSYDRGEESCFYFLGSFVSAGGERSDRCPTDLRESVRTALRGLLPLGWRLVEHRRESLAVFSAISAIAGLSGLCQIGRSVEGLDEKFIFGECPSCGEEMAIFYDRRDRLVRAGDLASETEVVPGTQEADTKVVLKDPDSDPDESKFGWLCAFADYLGNPEAAETFRYLCGDAACTECGHTFVPILEMC